MSEIINSTEILETGFENAADGDFTNQDFTTEDFTTTSIFTEIQDAAEKHKNQQLNFRFKAPEMIKLLSHLKKTPETEKLIRAVFQDALEKSDKRPMTEQLNLKAKYQKSHGLVFKDIPVGVQRHIIFDAILKLGRTMDFETGRLAFPGGCKLRSFFFPQIKHREQSHRVCFPIFVNKRDQMFIYQWAQNQNGKIQLDIDRSCGWDGVVSVELTRDASNEDDDTVSMISGVSAVSGVAQVSGAGRIGRLSSMSSMKGFNSMGNPITNNPLAGFSPENPFINPFMMNQFTHGGPVSPSPFNMHPNLIAHQNMMNQMSQMTASVTPASVSPGAQVKPEDIEAGLGSLSVKDSENSSSGQEVEAL